MTGSEITLPVSLESLAPVRAFVRSESVLAAFPEDRVFDLVLATDEAISNLVEHGHPPSGSAEFSVSFEFDGQTASVTISDTGVSFDPADRPVFKFSGDLDDRPIGGIGWRLILEAVDAVEYTTSSAGNRLTLKKRRSPQTRKRDTVLEIEIDDSAEIAVARVTGAVDAMTAPDLLVALETEMDNGSIRMVIDLSGTEYMSSAGLRALLAAVKKARAAGGDVRLASAQPNIQRVLDMSGFTSILKYYDDVAGAVGSMV